ncbi:MAG: copper homeostasis protein CutC [Planctomycetota bacterium]|nr:copper homeostasis protein CutC [Planctomycetota bacterium]
MQRFYVTAEVCAESAADARAAAEGGADRIELCAELRVGGLTPTVETLREARASAALPIVVMLRSRAGDFVLREGELEVVLAQAELLRAAGADGLVFGAVTSTGQVDREAVQRVAEAITPLPLVFHRAFDALMDQDAALEDLIRCGCARVLTSGDPRGVERGMDRLRALVALAGERIEVMPGGGVRAGNAAELARASGAHAIHFSAKSDYSSPLRSEDVRAVVSALRSV